MNTAEYLVKKLEELGVNDFFGVPGDYNFNILYAIENNLNTNWIGCTNELNAGYAADGYARQRGYGAVVTTYGAGELSVLNAIAGSVAENVPVISIVGAPPSGCIEEKKRVHHNLMDVNPQAFKHAYDSILETTAFLNRDNAKLEIDRVLKTFVKEKRPVYISIPLDVAKMEISQKDSNYEWFTDEETLEKVVEKIIDKIKKAEHPVILGDALVKRFDSKVEYREFVEKSGIPATNFIMGTGLLDSDCEKYLGTYFSKHGNPEAQKLLETTDCLIAVGDIYGDLNSFGFNLPYKITSHVAIYGTHTYIDGERYENIKMADVLAGLSSMIDKREFKIEKSEFGYEKSVLEGNILNSEYIYPRIQEFLKENDIVFAETGVSLLGMCKIKYPKNVEFHSQTLWGSIGWATPASFGASIANPKSRVVVVTGEGSHQISAMELGNMLRLGLKPVVIVINNGGYTIERVLSDKFDDKFNDIVQMNYSKFARVFDGDVWSTRVTTAEDFDKALKVTQIMDKLCYIEVCTSPDDVPELAQNVFGEAKKNYGSVPESNCNQPELKSEKAVLSKPENMNFGTTVHESLRG